MVKRRLPKLLLLIFILCATPQIAFTDEDENLAEGIIDFEEPIKDGYVSDGAISGYFKVEMWHHSGDTWSITFPKETETPLIGSATNEKDSNKTITIKDAILKEYWNDDNELSEQIKNEGAVWILQCELSQGVKNRLNNGSLSLSDIQPIISLDGRFHETFEKKLVFFGETMHYEIKNGNVRVWAYPRINFSNVLYTSHVAGLNKFIPIAKNKYGKNMYATFEREKNIWDSEESKFVRKEIGPAYADNAAAMGEIRKLLTYDMIANAEGNLHSGHEVNCNGSDRNSEDINIGDETFRNAGAVGIMFACGIKLEVFVPPESTPTLPNSDGRLRAEDRVFNGDGAYDESKEKFDVTLGIPATEELYANVIAQNYLREVEYDKKEGPVSHTVNVKKTYDFHWEDSYDVDVKCGTCDGSGNDPDNPTQDCSDCDGTGNEFCSECDGTGKDPDDSTKSCPDCDGYRYETSTEYSSYSESQTVTKPYVFTRNYSYWKIETLEVHELENAVVENGALNGGKVTVEVNDSEYCKPGVNYSLSGGIVSNPFDSIPKQNGEYTVTLPASTLYKEYHDVSDIPDENLFNDANSRIGQFRVKNDSLQFDSNVNDSVPAITILNGTEYPVNALAPASFPDIGTTNADVLYQENLKIPAKTPNGTYATTANVTYKRLANSVNPQAPEIIQKEIPDMNPVKVHTPVICNSGVWHDKEHSQSAGGAIPGCSDMVLGRKDKVRFKTDDLQENADDTADPIHLNIKGYQRNDYTKYTAKKYVQFPFDVYILDETDQKHPARGGEWVEVDKNRTLFDVELPVWVDEGEYTVKFKTVAINAPDDVINDPTIEGKQQKLANKNPENYVAYRDSNVRVVGQVYNLRITDIHDYPLWELVFRKRTGSAVHTDEAFTVGGYLSPFDNWSLTGNQSDVYHLPLMEGSHPNHKNYGALKTGYGFKFELNTVGNYFGNDDSIRIKPSFWYVNKDGTGRTEVDIYYNERFDGKENIMVRIGSDKDSRNIKTVENTNIFRNIPEEDIERTEKLTKTTFSKREVELGTFFEVKLNKDMRVFIGENENPGFTSTTQQQKERAAKALQRWYGEYYLPDKVYVVPSTMTENEIVNHSETQDGIDGMESFWLRDGYIIVNFEIQTIQNGDFSNPVLDYYNGLSNRWEKEGYDDSQIDYYGKTFQLEDGDIVFYHAGKKASDDYKVGGGR